MSAVVLYPKREKLQPIVVADDTVELEFTEPVSDFSNFDGFLSRLPKLEKLVLFVADLGKKDVTESLDFLREAKRLKWLSLGSMESLKDCAAVADCPNLEFINLDRRTSFQFSILRDVHSLQRLVVEMPTNSAIAEIRKATQLRDLELRGGFELASLEPLTTLKNLQKLRLWSGKLASSRGLRSFPKLEVLDLGYCGCKDTTELGQGRRIQKLELIGNKTITDLEFLEEGPLEFLGLNEIPKLDSIKPILRLPHLREFKSEATILDGDIAPLTEIPTLQSASVLKKYGSVLKRYRVDSQCTFEAGRERFKLTRDGPVVLETAAEAKLRLLRKLGMAK